MRQYAFGLARLFIIVFNVVHLAIHGTFLDHGIIDSVLEPLDMYAYGVAAWLNSQST